MTLQIACPGCDARLKIDEKFAGRNVVCKNCQTKFRISAIAGAQSPQQPGDRTRLDQEEGPDLEAGQLPPRQSVSESETFMAPIKRYKRPRGKKKQKRGRLDRNPIPVAGFVLFLVAGCCIWYAFLRPQGAEVTSATAVQMSETDESSDSPNDNARSVSTVPPAHRRTAPIAGGAGSQTGGKPTDRFRIVWAPSRVERETPELVAVAPAHTAQDAVDRPQPLSPQGPAHPTIAPIRYSLPKASSRQIPSVVGVAVPLIWLGVLVLSIAGIWATFAKAGEPGWGALIPIYNVIILLRVAGRPLWWILLLMIPGVNLLIAIVVSIDIAQNFGKHAGFGLGLAFLSFIFYPLLGFGAARYRPA
ncbi:MAG TPA: DUF5684 domain-containing protein [Planctomycetaceae bacterium]|jgi:hypothetical protein|nr:DUF5684 domain-containing protein [Planctomycetaceae bacterium]